MKTYLIFKDGRVKPTPDIPGYKVITVLNIQLALIRMMERVPLFQDGLVQLEVKRMRGQLEMEICPN